MQQEATWCEAQPLKISGLSHVTYAQLGDLPDAHVSHTHCSQLNADTPAGACAPVPLQPGATGAWIFNKWNQSGADMPGGPYMEWCPGEPDKPEEHQCAAYLLKCEQDPSRSGLMSVACSDKYTTMCSRDHSCSEWRQGCME